MNQKLGLQQNNEGFSLVELIVTILISSVVMAAVVGLLTTGLNLYKNVDAETRLQTEGQAACGRINELVQEAQYLRFYSNDGTDTDKTPLASLEGNNKVLVLMTREDGGTGYWYYIAWDSVGKMLLLTKEAVSWNGDGTIANVPDESHIAGKVSSMTVAAQKKKYLLAQYIDTFSFRKVDEKLFYVDILLATDGKQFSTSQFINERNK